MKWPDIYLLCFATGTIWTLVTMLLGGLHIGHTPGAHAAHGAGSHGVGAHAPHGPALHHHPHVSQHASQGGSHGPGSWLGSLLNPSSAAVFLAWFGGIGYLLTRHTGLLLWADLTVASSFGLMAAIALASFLRFLQAREKPLDPADYDMVGVLGRVSSPIRTGGVGELIFTRDGARKPVCARSEDDGFIGRDTEVVVTRFEKGIAYVRTWDAMLAESSGVPAPNPAKEKERVD